MSRVWSGGALLYLSLFWIVGRADRRIDAQHHALELQSRDVLAANEELRAVQARLIEAERMAAIGEVVASVAHGIRNPLANIRASAEVALLDCKDCDRAAVGPRSLANIMAEVDRLAVRLKELLQFVRPTERRSQPVDLNTVLQRALELLAGRIAEAHVRLEHRLAPALPVISGDPMILEQIFVNLVGNAVEAMSADGGIITLTTGAGRSRRSSTSSARPSRKGRAWAWPSPRSSPKPAVARSPSAVAPGMARPSVSRFRAGRRLSLIGPGRPGSPSVFHPMLLETRAQRLGRTPEASTSTAPAPVAVPESPRPPARISSASWSGTARSR